MKIKELCASERPREKLLFSGPGSLGNGELLAILLGSGSRKDSAIELGQKLLNLSDGRLCLLFNMSPDMMRSIPGIGKCKAAIVLSALELGRRFLLEKSSMEKRPIVTARTVYECMLPLLKGISHEECWLLLLNDSNYLISKSKLTSGGGRATVVDVRQIIKNALDKSASGLILVHNHPCGEPRPSDADITQTQTIQNACRTCGLELLDHIIVSDDCFYSFADKKVYLK